MQCRGVACYLFITIVIMEYIWCKYLVSLVISTGYEGRSYPTLGYMPVAPIRLSLSLYIYIYI